MLKFLVKEGPNFLLCVNYKIIAKIMGWNNEKGYAQSCFVDQIGFIPIWNINIENIIIFLEVQDYMHNSQKPMFIFLSYNEKSFHFVYKSFYKLLLWKWILNFILSLGFSHFTTNQLQGQS